MADPVEFYFDFSSPYAYFASTRIDRVAEKGGRDCVWKPILLGPVFKASGNTLLNDQPLKGAYARMDWERLSRFMEVPYGLPDPFPVNTVNAARIFYWQDDRDRALAHRFAVAVFHAYFADGVNVSDLGALLDIAEKSGIDRDHAAAATVDPSVKKRVKDEVDRALERGVCGAPFFFVDGEGYWGSDRIWMVKKVLAGMSGF
ncbi:MAG: 2-hydroxychromene-2-carboxylate isomerase [Rhodospirillales bacterium]